MKRWVAIALLCIVAGTGSAAGQGDCRAGVRCQQVPWQLPVLPPLPSPTRIPTAIATSSSGLFVPTSNPTATVNATATPAACPTSSSGGGQTYIQRVAATGPIAYWPLNETSGLVAVDASGNGRNGTYNGPALGAATAPDGSPAPSFDGVNDDIAIDPIKSVWPYSAGSLLVWIRMSSYALGYGNNLVAFQAQNGSSYWSITKQSTANLFQLQATTPVAYSASGAADVWIPVLHVWSAGGGTNTYWAGNVINSSGYSSALSGNLSNVNIGSGNGAYTFMGNIAHVAVWNRALTGGEVASLSSPGAPQPTQAPTPTDCVPGGSSIEMQGVINAVGTMQAVANATQSIAVNPAQQFDLYAGAANVFGYIRGVSAINFGPFTPFIGFLFMAFFGSLLLYLASMLAPLISALIGAARKLIQVVLDFIPG